MRRQSNSDPLPYVQVDRAVEPTAALLAGHMKVTNQHAIGSLVGFWKLCGDPRELERIVESTPPGEEPEVILSTEDVALRFQLAADHRVEPVVLARLGILEQRDEGHFRVRGMSRFFEPIVRRLVKRSIGRVGGKASAEARKAATGTAQPVADLFGAGSGSASDGASAVVKQARSNAEATPKQHRSTEQHSGQRSAVSGQQSNDEEDAAPTSSSMPIAAFEVTPPDIERIEAWTPQEFWRAAECSRRALGYPPQKWPSPKVLSQWWAEARGVADVAVLGQAFERFARTDFARSRAPPAPFELFAKTWSNHLPSGGRP